MPDLHVLPGLWTVNLGYSALRNWLDSKFHLINAPLDDKDRYANFLPVPYDWRLSNRYKNGLLLGLPSSADIDSALVSSG
jgi:hypothetical protein